MERLLKEALNTSKLSVLGQFGGYIAKEAAGYEIDGGKRIFVKCGVRMNWTYLFHIYVLLIRNRQRKSLKENLLACKQCNGPIQLESQTPYRLVYKIVLTKQTYFLPDSTTSRRQ